MPEEPSTIDLGEHALELSEHSLLIASHTQSIEIPIREVVQLSEEEAYNLYIALHTRFERGRPS